MKNVNSSEKINRVMISPNNNNNETLIGENIINNNEINNINNNKLETNYNNNSLNKQKKLTDIEKCFNELKNQISNVRNCSFLFFFLILK